MTCRGCQRDIDDSAPFCPLCGADPLLGEPWLETLGHAEEGIEPFATEGTTGEEVLQALALPAFRCAHELYEAEAAVAQVLEEEVKYGSGTARAHLTRVFMLIPQSVDDFQTTCRDIAISASQQVPPEEFSERYPQLAWLWDGEYAPYLQARSPMDAADYLVRRARKRLGLLGHSVPAAWASPGGGYRIDYNGLLLTTLPGEVGAYMPGMENIEVGPGCRFGRLEVAIVPAAWRFWADFMSAPNAFVLAYVHGDALDLPLRDGDSPSEGLLRFARLEALALERKHGVEVARDATITDGVPTVECDFTHPWGERVLLQRYVWRFPGDETVFLRAVADSAAGGYLSAVMEVASGARALGACAA